MLISAEERVANDGGDELIMGVCFRFQWHRTATTQETDGFQVKRPGDVSVRCTLLLMLDYQVSAAPLCSHQSGADAIRFLTRLLGPAQPPQFKLDPRLARLLGIHTQTRSCIIQALWQYIKTNKLQDSHDKEYINCDKYFQQVGRKTPHLRCGYQCGCGQTSHRPAAVQ